MTRPDGVVFSRAKFYAVLALAAAVLIGGAGGFEAGRASMRNMRGANVTLLGVSRATLLDSLGATRSQRASIDKLLDDAARRAETTVGTLMSEVRTITRTTRQQVRSLLDERQQARFDSILAGVPEPRLRSPVPPPRSANP
jgi:hypothetical protein